MTTERWNGPHIFETQTDDDQVLAFCGQGEGVHWRIYEGEGDEQGYKATFDEAYDVVPSEQQHEIFSHTVNAIMALDEKAVQAGVETPEGETASEVADRLTEDLVSAMDAARVASRDSTLELIAEARSRIYKGETS